MVELLFKLLIKEEIHQVLDSLKTEEYYKTEVSDVSVVSEVTEEYYDSVISEMTWVWVLVFLAELFFVADQVPYYME